MTQTQQTPSEPAQGARRYPRTFGGLIASMIVAVIGVVAYWALQNATHDRPEIQPEAVDYLGTVQTVQEAKYAIAYPPTLPAGAIATAVRFTPGDRPVWGLSVLTKDDKFIGVEQENEDLSTLLTTYVDKHARQGKDVTLTSGLATGPTAWTTWSDSGGDHAFATKLGTTTVVVYGSASVEDLQAVAESLTTAPTTAQTR
ncbi:DUF4245 family protein [Nocardioides sp.]|uniref:DUF4245 family protein n=1 Tax=Nocardioides sp. TaxID=35761 RepID=UPI00261CDC44|nr:DUF4245 family protein [Nocardioides sp.]